MCSAGVSAQLFQLVDKAANHAEALRPEGRIARVKTERRQQFAVAQGAAGAQQVEIALGKASMRVLVDRVERVHQAIAERVGVDVELRVDEMRDVGPVV